MKKAFLLLLILLSTLVFAGCVGKSKINAIDSDCEYLKKVLEEAAIDVSKSIEEGLDSAQLIEDIKSEYARLLKKQWLKSELNENGIASNQFAQAINNVFAQELTRPNCHISVYGDSYGYAPFVAYAPYFSDVYFEKSGDEYVVFSSDNTKIKPGMKYTGDSKDLYKTFMDGKELYRFGILANKYPYNSKINIEGKKYRVRVSIYTGPVEQPENLSYTLDDKVLKIIFSSCNWQKEAEYNRMMEALASISKIIREEEVDLVLIDMRRNGGGKVGIAQELAAALNGIVDGSQQESDFFNYASYLSYGAVYINTLTTRTVNALVGRGSENLNQELLGRSDSRYVLLNQENEDKFIREYTPGYNGKIILLTDWGTASAAEDLIAILKMQFKDKVLIVGQNTLGCLDYGNVHDYLLRNSRLKVSLCQTDNTNILMLNSETGWHGDGLGFYPDYWYRLDEDLDINELIELFRK